MATSPRTSALKINAGLLRRRRSFPGPTEIGDWRTLAFVVVFKSALSASVELASTLGG